MRRALLLAVVLTAVSSACSDDGTTVDAGDGGATSTTTTSTITAPPSSAARGLVLQVRTAGGFVPVEYAFATVPEFSLYADGRVIAVGPTTAEFPGPALPNMLTGRVGADKVRALVAAAEEAGVTGAPDLGRPTVADAPTTTFLLFDEGRTSRVEAYALGSELDDGLGLTPAQRDSRRRLSDLRRRTEEAAAAADERYRATVLSVLVRPAEAISTDQAESPPPLELDWPLADLAAGGTEQLGGRCLGYTGADAERALAVAAKATANARWRSGGRQWVLAFRPELPDVAPCAPER